jgi:hypothetical protein
MATGVWAGAGARDDSTCRGCGDCSEVRVKATEVAMQVTGAEAGSGRVGPGRVWDILKREVRAPTPRAVILFSKVRGAPPG